MNPMNTPQYDMSVVTWKMHCCILLPDIIEDIGSLLWYLTSETAFPLDNLYGSYKGSISPRPVVRLLVEFLMGFLTISCMVLSRFTC